MIPASSLVALPSGMKIGIRKWRAHLEPQATIVLIHGLGDTSAVWYGIAPTLALHNDVLALDLRGHGTSDSAEAVSYTVSQMAKDLHELLDQLEIPRPILIGHSLGGAVAVNAVALNCTRFGAAILVDYSPEVAVGSLSRLHRVLADAHRGYATTSEYATVLRTRHLLADPQLLEQVAAGSLRATASGYVVGFDIAIVHTLARQDADETAQRAWSSLAQMALPVLVVRGAWSWMLSHADALRVVATCPAAHLAVVPKAGHSVQLDNPSGLLAALNMPQGPLDRVLH